MMNPIRLARRAAAYVRHGWWLTRDACIRRIQRRHETQWRLWRRCWPLKRTVTVRRAQGRFALPLDIDDPISYSLYVYGQHELDLTRDAMALIRDVTGMRKGEGTLLDIGANMGPVSIGMVVTGEVARAVAIEPEPRNFARLERNVRLNGLADVIVRINAAVSDAPGELAFELSPDNYGDHRVHLSVPESEREALFGEAVRRTITVPAETLDNLVAGLDARFREDIRVAWLDTQGFERHIFAGGQRALAGVPAVTEICPYAFRRVGVTSEAFTETVATLWSAYWIQQDGRFVRRPLSALPALFEEIGWTGGFTNVVFTA